MKSFLLALVLFTSALFAEDFAVDVSSVHRIKLLGKGTDYWTATAFFIDDHRLLTAAHTFKHGKNNIFVVIDGADVECRLLKVNFKGDVDSALLEVIGYKSPTFCTIASGVVIVGFPGGGNALEQNTGFFKEKIHTTNHIVDGMSGCPLFFGGAVIGMGVQSELLDKNVCKSIPSSVLLNFLNTPAK